MATKQTKRTRVTAFADNAKITVLKPYEARAGSKRAVVWGLLSKSKTIAAYRAARKRAKLGDNLGGMWAI